MDLRFDDLLAENQDLYLFECDEGRVMFRLLPYKRFASAKYIIQAYPEFRWSVEENIWESCVVEHTILNGADVDHLSAGIVSTVVQLIFKNSCASTPSQASQELAESRYALTDAVQQAIIFICEAFPSYLPEHLENLTWRDILKRIAQAEIILNKSFEFRDVASQPIDDSGRILQELNKRSQDTMVDKIASENFNPARENAQLHKEEWSAPKGDFDIRNRGR